MTGLTLEKLLSLDTNWSVLDHFCPSLVLICSGRYWEVKMYVMVQGRKTF